MQTELVPPMQRWFRNNRAQTATYKQKRTDKIQANRSHLTNMLVVGMASAVGIARLVRGGERRHVALSRRRIGERALLVRRAGDVLRCFPARRRAPCRRW